MGSLRTVLDLKDTLKTKISGCDLDFDLESVVLVHTYRGRYVKPTHFSVQMKLRG